MIATQPILTVLQALDQAIAAARSVAVSKGITIDLVFIDDDDASRTCILSLDRLKGLIVGLVTRAPEAHTVCITIMDDHVFTHVRLPETNVLPLRGFKNPCYGLQIMS